MGIWVVLGAIMNHSAVNFRAHVLVWTGVRFSREDAWGKIGRTCDHSLGSPLRSCRTALHSGRTILQSHQRCPRGPLPPHLTNTCHLMSVFFVLDTLVGVKPYLTLQRGFQNAVIALFGLEYFDGFLLISGKSPESSPDPPSPAPLPHHPGFSAALLCIRLLLSSLPMTAHLLPPVPSLFPWPTPSRL